MSHVVDLVLQCLRVPVAKRAEMKGRVLQELIPIPFSLPSVPLSVSSSIKDNDKDDDKSKNHVGKGKDKEVQKGSRPALKILPVDMLDQIRNRKTEISSSKTSRTTNNLTKSNVRAPDPVPEKQDMRSILERRILEMRFLNSILLNANARISHSTITF